MSIDNLKPICRTTIRCIADDKVSEGILYIDEAGGFFFEPKGEGILIPPETLSQFYEIDSSPLLQKKKTAPRRARRAFMRKQAKSARKKPVLK